MKNEILMIGTLPRKYNKQSKYKQSKYKQNKYKQSKYKQRKYKQSKYKQRMDYCIASLRTQVGTVPGKLCPLAEAHKYKLDKLYLCYNVNPMALDYILRNPKEFPTYIIVHGLSQNPSAIAFLEKNKSFIIPGKLFENPNLSQKLFDFAMNNFYSNFYYKESLSSNPSDVVVNHLLSNPTKIDWYYFSKNTNIKAVAFMKKNKKLINWSCLSGNENNGAIQLLKENPELIDFDQLSLNSNPKAFELLLTFPDECINYNNLSANTNPNAVAYLIQNKPEEINWSLFSQNPTAMPYLEVHLEKINFNTFWKNPAIFQINEQAVCKEMSDAIKQQLLDIFMSPDRVDRLREQGVSFREIMDNL